MMKHVTSALRFGILALLLGLATTLSAQVGGVPGAIIDIENQNYRTAIKKLDKVKDDGNRRDRAVAQYYLGFAKYMLGVQRQQDGLQDRAESLFAEAETHFDEGMNLKRDYPYNYAGKGLIQAQRLEVDNAKANLQKAIEMAPSDVDLLITIAEAYVRIYKQEGVNESTQKNAIREATKILTRATTIDEENSDIKIALGDVYNAQNIPDLAKTNYQEAIEINPGNAEAHYKLGKLLLEQEKYQEAQAALLQAKDVRPDFAPTYLALAELYMLAQQYKYAKKELEAYRDLLQEAGSDMTYVNAQYGINLYLTKNFEEAVTQLQSALQDTSSFVLQRLYAYSLAETDQYEQAKTAIETFFNETEKKFIIAKDYRYHGTILHNLGQNEAAIEKFNKAVEMDPRITGVYKSMYEIYKENEEYEQAVYYLTKEYEQTNSLTDLFYVGYYTYSKLGEYEKADSIFAVLNERAPTFIDAFYYRGMADIRIENEDTTKQGIAVEPFIAMINQVEEQGKTEKYGKQLKSAYEYLAIHFYREEEDDESYKYLKALKALDPDNATVEKLMPYVSPEGEDGTDAGG